MPCIASPAVDDVELLMFLDGEAESSIATHLDACAHCHARAVQLAQVQARTTAHLFRATCSTSEELREYHFGFLPADQATAITQHMALCPHCTRELVALNGYLEQDPLLNDPLATEADSAPTVVERVRVVVAELLQGASGGLNPAFAGVRSTASLQSSGENMYVYMADDVQIALRIRDDAQQPGQKVMMGLVTGMAVDGVQVHLWQNEQLVVTHGLDMASNFLISQLVPGQYTLILSGIECKIQVPALEIA